MARTSQGDEQKRKKAKVEDIEVEIIEVLSVNSNSDSSDNDSVGIPVAEVVEDKKKPDPPEEEVSDSEESIKTTESTRRQAEGLIRRGRIQDGLSLVQALEEDFLDGIQKAIDKEHDPFWDLRWSYHNTDFDFLQGLDEDLDARIARIKTICHIPARFDTRGSYVLYRSVKKDPKDQRVNGIDSDES